VDNGTQFDAETFKDFCDQIGTKIHFASFRHPESNGLVERANGIIMTGIMKLIFNQPRGKWPNELIKVVWSHNTTISRSIGFTPFKLLFGDEAITPEEAKAGSIRTVASAGHLVLRRVANPDVVGKLQLKWEGPFLVVSSSRPDSYRLNGRQRHS
jgi:transposase InsO family protein